MSRPVTLLKRSIHRMVAHVVGFALRPGATYDPCNFKIWERRGYHITPVHFYSPIPDTRELDEAYPPPSSLVGIDLRTEFQLKLLEEVFPQYAIEYNAFPSQPADPTAFYLNNDAFNGIDPHVYYCFVRHIFSQVIIEVGSGYSTLLGFQAIQVNNTSARLIVIDPWPRDFTSDFLRVNGRRIEYIPAKVQEVAIDLFLQLQENDILFIDGSHVVRTGSDVCFLFQEVIPRLSEGVIVHFHDIFLPFDYPKEWVVEKHVFWTEQYMLQAYLTENSHAEVLFAAHFISSEYPDMVRTAFPNALWWGGGSFWIRKSDCSSPPDMQPNLSALWG